MHDFTLFAVKPGIYCSKPGVSTIHFWNQSDFYFDSAEVNRSNIYVSGSEEKQRICQDVHSTAGHVLAKYAQMNSVKAKKNMELSQCTTSSATSETGHVHAKDSSLTTIQAARNMTLERVKTHTARCLQGHLFAQNSKLGEAEARDIELINSSAKSLQAAGKVNLVQDDEKVAEVSLVTAGGNIYAKNMKLGQLAAQGHVDLINCSADYVESAKEVSIKQEGSLQCPIEYINSGNKIFLDHVELKGAATCHNQAILHNSQINKLKLIVSQKKENLLDLTNTTVTGKISVKVNYFVHKTIHAGWLCSSTTTHSEYVGIKQFSLLIKGCRQLPENIHFKGFNNEEIQLQATEAGLLVKAKKKE